MTILGWNCRGLGTSSAIRALKDVVKTSRPLIVGLLETKANKRRCEEVRVQVGFRYCFSVSSRGKAGGMALMWQDEIEVDIVNYSFYHIDFIVQSSTPFRATLFYGHPRSSLRYRSWDLLRRLRTLSTLPWCVLGDFNEVLQESEMSSDCAYRRRFIQQFRDVLLDCHLSDIGFVGPKFTFSNRRMGQFETKCRLDRVVADRRWRELFPHASVKHIVTFHSDHSPIIVNWCGSSVRGSKLFRFENMWMRDPNLKDVIRESWSENEGCLMDKLDKLKSRLQTWNQKAFGHVNTRIKTLKRSLLNIRSQPRTTASVDEERRIITEIDEWLVREEQMWLQRSRVSWMKEGDNNTKYFHHKANSRRRMNQITSLLSQEGVQCDVQADIQSIAVAYFATIFSSQHSSPAFNIDYDLGHVPSKVTDEHNSLLNEPYSEREIFVALSQLYPSKASGLDDFHAGFFQKNWMTVKRDFMSACLFVLHNGVVPANLNDTLIVLIPKQKNVMRIKEYRPISLTTVVSRTIAKAIANRLQLILTDVINPAQTAFVKGRSITDNFLIAHEVAHFIKNVRRGRSVYGSLKLDMSKAYDRIEWDFLRAMLLKLGFTANWVSMIMHYISSIRYCIKVNDHITSFLNPQRGLRQGDPLSPYLFIICTEWLSYKLQSLHDMNILKGLKVCRRAPVVSHLFFADDCLLLFKADQNTAAVMRDTLALYEKVSGQMINYGKSEFVLSPNAAADFKNAFCGALSTAMPSIWDCLSCSKEN
ncbi:unnamed protein product [Rhodiola kirilowii]